MLKTTSFRNKVDELDKAYVRSQHEVYELRKTLREQKKLLDKVPKDVMSKLEKQIQKEG